MIIYLYLIIPPLFLSVESSSIRGRNNKNELVPLMSSGVDTPAKDNNLKVVSNEPFIIQLHVPRHNDSKSTREKDKKRKRPAKKRNSKLRKKHRTRRDLRSSRLIKRSREEKAQPPEIPILVNGTEVQLKNTTKNSINRVEILKALSSYSRKKQNKTIEELEDDVEDNKRTHPFSDKSPFVKMIYPSTPKIDRHSYKYTYKDLMADRKRLEQKINYIKNMFSANDSATDDAVRIRRRTESDKTANKIAKMFLTLSAVNGLRDRRKTRCKDDEDDADRVQDVWEKEQRGSPNRKASSSNAERYKVKKWIEFMKNTRSSGKTCPCMASLQGDDSDAFPLEQKLPKDYFLMERSRSSEESSETYYNSRDKPYRRKYNKDAPDNKLKALGKNGKKKLDLPLNDLEVYRSRAKQILQNAEEILDKIKEEEERRLSAPSILMSQLKELTSRIQSDPRNNENDLIKKMQKTLGWKPLSAKGRDGSDVNTFIDNVKSYILDPYEKAKALTDESAKTLSSYLLRNLGKMQDSSEEVEPKQSDDETQVFFGEVPTKEEKPLPANLAKENAQPDLLAKTKEELQNWEDTISTIMQGPEETVQKVPVGEIYKNKMEDIMKEQQKKLDDYEEEKREADGDDKKRPGIKLTKPEKLGGHKHPIKLKPKDGIDKDKLKNTENHFKIPPKAPKPDTLGGDKHSFRLKPKDGNVHEHGKPVKEIGNHQKHPIHGHLKTHPKGRKTVLPKATDGVEEPERAASKEEELGKEILEEIVKTLENDTNPVGDPQQEDNQAPLKLTLNEDGAQLGETISGIPKTRPLSHPEDGDANSPAPQYPPDYDLLPGDEDGTPAKLTETVGEALEDLNGLPNEDTLVQKPETVINAEDKPLEEVIDPLLREAEQLETELIKHESNEDPGVINPLLKKAEQLETQLTGKKSELENVSAEDNLEDAIDPILEMAQRLETELDGRENESDVGSNDPSDVATQGSERVNQESLESAPESSRSNEEGGKDPLNLKFERQNAKNRQPVEDELRATLNQQDDEDNSGKTDSEEEQESSEERPDEKLRAVLEEESPEMDEYAPLKAAKSENLEESEEIPLKQALENDDNGERETLENNEDEDDGSSLGKALKTEDDPVGKSLGSEEDKPNDEESRLRKALDKEKEEKFDNPLRKSLGSTDEIPLRKTLESKEEEDEDDDVENPLRKASKEQEVTPLRENLEKEERKEFPLGEALESKEDGNESPLREASEKQGNNEDKEDDADDETSLRKAMESKDGVTSADDDDDEAPLKKTMESKEDEGDDSSAEDADETPLRESLGSKDDGDNSADDDDDETPLKRKHDGDNEETTPLRKTMSGEDQQKGDASAEDEEESPLRKTLQRKGDDSGDDEDDKIPLRKTMKNESDEDDGDDETPLRKIMKEKDEQGGDSSSKDNGGKIPLRKTPKSTEDRKDDESPLRKTMKNREGDDVSADENDEEPPLRKTMENTDDEETPLRKTLSGEDQQKGDASAEDEEESPLRKTLQRKNDKFVDDKIPLKKTMKNKTDKKDGDDETPLGKIMKNEEGDDVSADENDEESPLRKTMDDKGDDVSADADDEETPLRKTMKNREDIDVSVDENDEESPLRETMKNTDDEDDDGETPLRKTMENKDEQGGDSSSKDNGGKIPLRKTLKSIKGRKDDKIPLRKTMKNREDDDVSADENDDETPFRKTMDNREGDDVSSRENSGKIPLRKTLKSTKNRNDGNDDETPLEKTMENREDENVSADVNDDETPLRKTMENKDGDVSSRENGGQTPLRKTLKNPEDENDERKRMQNEQYSNASADDVDDEETPLRKAMENQEDGNVSADDEIPLRKTIKSEEEDDNSNDDETPLRKTMENTDEQSGDASSRENDGQTPLRKPMENKNEYGNTSAGDDDDEETPLRKTMENQEDGNVSDDEIPLRKTMKSEEEEDNSNDETPLRNALEDEKYEDAETLREESPTEEAENSPSSKTTAEYNDQTILKEPNTQTEGRASEEETIQQKKEDPESFRTVSSEENQSEQNELEDPRGETPLRATPNKQENSQETPLQGEQNRDNPESSADEDNLKSAIKQQQEDDEGDETSEEVALNRKDGLNPETDAESLLRSAEDAENFDDGDNLRAENPDEQTSEEIPLRSSLNDDSFEDVQEKTNEEKPESQEKSGEALRVALETLAEDMENEPEDGSTETVKASLSNEASEGETPVGRILEGSNEDGNPIKMVLHPEDGKKDEEQLDTTQNSEETPLRVSLNQDDGDTENPLRNASQENELDSNVQETPLKSEQTVDEVQEDTNSEEVRAEDTQNQIDGTDETPSNENSLETLREANPLGEDDTPEENSSIPDFLQMSEKSPKTGTLKLPKSIGQIMKDLDGRTKDDITSLKNLNPDKIDDMIGKIGEAEQQNLLEHPDVDCRKECACAEEIDTRSRNIGRYEIVKDFLHWMKDLQLNRVLTDD